MREQHGKCKKYHAIIKTSFAHLTVDGGSETWTLDFSFRTFVSKKNMKSIALPNNQNKQRKRNELTEKVKCK